MISKSRPAKPELIEEAEAKALDIENQFRKGLITEDERYSGVVEVWTETTDRLTDVLTQSMDRYRRHLHDGHLRSQR